MVWRRVSDGKLRCNHSSPLTRVDVELWCALGIHTTAARCAQGWLGAHDSLLQVQEGAGPRSQYM